MQSTILDESSKIETELIKKWSRDIVYSMNTAAFVEMFVKFYSKSNDGVVFVNCDPPQVDFGSREIIVEDFPCTDSEPDGFWVSPFFNRFCVDIEDNTEPIAVASLGNSTYVNGDSRRCIAELGTVFMGAVTSPPYYNDRDYSNWPNIYCYLNDMYLVAKQVFASLEKGSIYLYNIFDTFGNEAAIATSILARSA